MALHPSEESINITRKFLGGGGQSGGGQGALGSPPRKRPGLPPQASPVAGQRAFGQQGTSQSSLGDRFLGLPGPAGFAQTPQGKAILQRILGGIGRRR